MTTKCVIYRRYSTDEQGKGQGQTLATQLEACEEYARRKGWVVIERLTDDGFSAFRGEHLQPGADLYDFVERINAGAIEPGTILLAYNPSRLSRLEPDRIMSWVYTTLTSRGFGLAFANKDKVFKANPTIEEHIGMVLSFAQTYGESADKSENVLRAKRKMWDLALIREGKWTNLAARPPLWLTRNENRNGWKINEERAALIRDIYQWSADGLGAVTIANRLNSASIAPWGVWRRYQDQKWGRSAVRQLLENPAVEGDFVPETGQFVGRVINDFYPRIVDADLVARARANQKARTKTAGARSSTGTSNLFAGLTVCGECWKKAFLSTNNKGGRPYSYVRCEGASDGRACTNTAYYAYGAFEETALDIFLDLALDDRFFEATGELREGRIREAELKKSIEAKRTRRKQIMRDFDPDDQDAREIAAELKTEIDRLAEELESVQAAVLKASGKVGAVEHLKRVGDIREAAKSDDAMVREQARSKLRLALSTIVMRVELDRTPEGEKVFMVMLKAGIMAVRIDTKGRIVKGLSDALGRPLYDYLPAEHREMLAPLINRIEKLAA